ncbi:MAG: hypothetical protein A2W30_02730 [Ignavibacteria bacterium RBG_16_36_9]|nr:MAG: hypothetical protein A2W30_02730 [Ignavibacteria bacterium RBG_16_36_9]
MDLFKDSWKFMRERKKNLVGTNNHGFAIIRGVNSIQWKFYNCTFYLYHFLKMRRKNMKTDSPKSTMPVISTGFLHLYFIFRGIGQLSYHWSLNLSG